MRPLLALLAEFAHDLCDVNGGTGGHLGLQLLLLLPEYDGAETGPSLLCILLQLGITGRPQKSQRGNPRVDEKVKKREEKESEMDQQRKEEGGKDKVKIRFWRVMDVLVSESYRDTNISQRDEKHELCVSVQNP